MEVLSWGCARGSSIPAVAAHAEQLAVCLAAREVRVWRDRRHAAWGDALLVRRDPLDGVTAPWPCAGEAGPLSLWRSFPVGIDELGGTVTLSMPERDHLIAAGLRGGKGVPDTVGGHPAVFMTLTAPSFGPAERSTSYW